MHGRGDVVGSRAGRVFAGSPERPGLVDSILWSFSDDLH